jgi:hypothetical protein
MGEKRSKGGKSTVGYIVRTRETLHKYLSFNHPSILSTRRQNEELRNHHLRDMHSIEI